MRSETKMNISVFVGGVVGLAVVVWMLVWIYRTWGLGWALLALLLVPETVGYWSYMLSALLMRGLLGVVPTRDDPEPVLRLDPVAVRPAAPVHLIARVHAMPILAAEPTRGGGRLTEHADGSWTLQLDSGQVRSWQRPWDQFTGYRVLEDGSITLEWRVPEFWRLYIKAPNAEWRTGSSVLAVLPEVALED